MIKHLLANLSLKRFVNLFRVYSSFQLSKILKRPIVWGKPFAFSIEPTTACNLGCTECPSGLKKFTRNTGNLKLEELEKWLPQIKKKAMYVNFYFQGEPLIHPNLAQAISMADNAGIFTSISSNAHFITPQKAEELIKAGLRKIIVSIDGITQESYEQYRVHGVLAKVLEGTKNLVEAKSRLKSSYPIISWQMVVFSSNEKQIPEAKKLAKEYGVDEIKFKTAQFYDYENGHPLMPNSERYSRYKKLDNGKFAINNKLPNFCWRLWQSSVLTWDGHVVPCCFDKDADYKMGKLNGVAFDKVWKNKPYQNFRSKVLKGRKHIDICANCSEGSKVWN
ncbi:radical SAM/SPASM domain-containing protein [Luteibaculum oceani]|nr:radical SAM/SPASM domain-containing protein [Luteibaculum oceani]